MRSLIVRLYWHAPRIAVVGTVVCIAFFWLELSNTEYQVPNRVFFAKTSGWFVLGLPLLVPCALAFGILLGWIARRWGMRTGWYALWSMGLPMLVIGLYRALPETRVRNIIGREAASRTKLLSFRQHDTFNEGTFSCGTLAYSDVLMAAIRKLRPALRRSTSTHYGPQVADGTRPKYVVERFVDERSHFLVSPDRREVNFVYRSRPGPLGIPNIAIPDTPLPEQPL